MKKHYGKSELDVKAEVIYDLITSGELDRDESIATIKLNLELATYPPKDMKMSINCPKHGVQVLGQYGCAECFGI